MAQGVKRPSTGWETGALALARERTRERLRVDRVAERIGEDEVAIVVGVTGEVALE